MKVNEYQSAPKGPSIIGTVECVEGPAKKTLRSKSCIAAPSFQDSAIYQGDALAVLRTFPPTCVQSVVTSPPYWGLRDYNIPNQIGFEQTLPEFIARLRGIFSEVRRVLRDDGMLWLNIGDGYTSGNRGWRAPDKKNPARAMEVRPNTPEGLKPKDLLGIPWRLAFALQDDGWYLRADIIWHKPNAMPESVKDRPTRAHEYLFMFTKSEKYLYDRQAILFGYSQKLFYTTATGIGRFKAMEERGVIAARNCSDLPIMCQHLGEVGAMLLAGMGSTAVSDQFLDDLTLLTLVQPAGSFDPHLIGLMRRAVCR